MAERSSKANTRSSASGAAHLIFRTAWVYATEGKNFLLTILRLATQREELKIVRDQTGAPTLNSEIAPRHYSDSGANVRERCGRAVGRGGQRRSTT